METKSNKTIVLECYRKMIRNLDLSAVAMYIHDDYIQHSPTVKDGKAGLQEMLAFLKTLPGQGEIAPTPIIRVIADGDLVAVHLDVKFMSKRWAVVDLYRLKDGKLAEHWDVGQEQPLMNEGLITMTNGSTVIEDSADTQGNKQTIAKLFISGVINNRHLTPGFVEHNPASALAEYPGNLMKVHRILGEGNFVVVHSQVVEKPGTFARFDIIKFEDERISEHWAVKQQVPETMAHGNGMF